MIALERRHVHSRPIPNAHEQGQRTVAITLTTFATKCDFNMLNSKTDVITKWMNFVCGRQHCHATLFTFCLLLTNTFCLFRWIEPFLFCAISESGFDFHLGLIFVICRFCLVVLRVLWRPRSRRGSCQVGYIVPTSWQLPIWSIRTAVTIICKVGLWKATLSDNLIHVFYPSE